MANYFIKLDWGWRDDSKVMDYEDRHGKAALVDVIVLFCLMSEFGGCIELADRGARLRCERALGKRGKALDRFLEGVAECGIVKAEWLAAGRVASDRSLRDGKRRQARREAAAAASEAAAAKRAAAAASGTVADTVTDAGTVA